MACRMTSAWAIPTLVARRLKPYRTIRVTAMPMLVTFAN